MSKPLIAIDIDDTIADTTELIRLIVNSLYKVNIPREAYRSQGDYWGYYVRVWAEYGLNDLKLDDIEDKTEELANINLLPSALYVIQQLFNKFDIVLITARRQEKATLTRQWVKSKFAGMNIAVHFSEAHKNESNMTKGQICKQLGALFLIDDNVDHCEGALSQGVTPLLFGQYGWQRAVPDSITRCKDWPSVLDYFEKL